MRPLLAWAAIGLALAACSSVQKHEFVQNVPPEQMNAYLADKPPEARRLYARVLLEGKRNEVLNHMRAGLAAMELGDDDNAAKSFDIALDTIEAIYADNAKAAEARSLWTKENFKDFKGEPYERAMAYYYRGLLYMRAGDYENARASFKGGILQSTYSYDERFDADFALLDFLEGWAARCAGAGNIADDSFAAGEKRNKALAAPPTDHNVLILAEFGNPPRKVAKGRDRELLSFIPGAPAREAAVTVMASSGVALVRPTALGADLYYEASTRNGRAIDGVLEGKAQFKNVTGTASAVAVGAGAALLTSDNKNVQAAGAILALAGVIGTVVASAVRPEADLRTWDNIPGLVGLTTLSADALKPNGASPALSARFLDSFGNEVGRRPIVLKTAGRCSLGWVRARSALAVPDSAPGAIAGR